MRNKLMLVGSSFLAFAACSDSGVSTATADPGNGSTVTQNGMQDTSAAGDGMATAPMTSTADAYVMNASIGDLYEIQSSKLALEKSQSAEVKKFAQQMVTDHTATSAKLKATIAEAGLQLAPAMQLDARRQGMVDALSRASGAAFDKAYLDQQTAAHQEALALHSGFARAGDNGPLNALAAATAPRIQHHFEMVSQMNGGGADSTR